MDHPRATFAFVQSVEYRLKATAALLGVSENTLRNTLAKSDILVKRANQKNPSSPSVRIFDIDTVFKIADYRRENNLTPTPKGKKPIVLAVDLIKGGVGKTTTACEIAVLLQLRGLKVLAIDIDIQANLTQMMGYEADLTLDEAEDYNLTAEAIVTGTFYNLCAHLADRNIPRQDAQSIIKRPFGHYGPALIPSDTFLSDLEHAIARSTGPRELLFKKFFNQSSSGRITGLNVGDYDVVIFDCPPSTSFISTNAIACSDFVIAPVKMESFSVKGLSRLVSEINAIQTAYPNDTCKPELVILPTHLSTNLPRIARMQEKLSAYREWTAPCAISQSEEFPKATEKYLPVTLCRPTCTPVKEYAIFADHLIKKILARTKDVAQAKV